MINLLNSFLAFSSLLTCAGAVSIKRAAPLPDDAVKIFSSNRLEQVGVSVANVCNNDYSVSGYSCITADLRALKFEPEKLIYDDSRIITISDDAEMHEVFIYAYINKPLFYSKASLSFKNEDFFAIKTKEEITTSFQDFPIEAVSVSSDFKFVKYLIKDVKFPKDWWLQEERNYVLREIIDEDGNYVPSAINYAVGKDDYGVLKVDQTNLNAYKAEQLLCETYIHIADKDETIPLRYDSRIMGQFILLFNLLDKSEEQFTEHLRAVEVIADHYQWYGPLNLKEEDNMERGAHVITQMIDNNWKSGEKGTLPGLITKKDEVKGDSLLIEPEPNSIEYKNNFWNIFTRKKYVWNDLDFTKNLETQNKHYSGERDFELTDYTYYAVLNTFNFEISPETYDVDGSDSTTKDNYWKVSNRNDKYLPYCYENVSLAQFWWEENGQLRNGIVLSEYNDSYGTVVLVEKNSSGLGKMITDFFIDFWWIFLVIVLLILAPLIIPILPQIVKGICVVIKYIFLFISWPIRFIFRKIRGD